MRLTDINTIQASILRELFARDDSRFAELNVEHVPSDQFSYHLRQLIRRGFIKKSTDNKYSLSIHGRGRVIMLYPDLDGFIEQGFLAVRVGLTKVEGGKQYFLMRERTLVPYQGTFGTPGDKILFSEDVAEAAARAMKQQTGLECDVRQLGLTHIKEKYQGEFVQDKYFFIFTASNPKGVMIPESRNGKNVWMTYDEVAISGRSIQGGLEILDIIRKGQPVPFTEVTFEVDNY